MPIMSYDSMMKKAAEVKKEIKETKVEKIVPKKKEKKR